jgi:hypothetical protein
MITIPTVPALVLYIPFSLSFSFSFIIYPFYLLESYTLDVLPF